MSGGVQLIILENTIYISVFVVIVCVRVCVGGMCEFSFEIIVIFYWFSH